MLIAIPKERPLLLKAVMKQPMETRYGRESGLGFLHVFSFAVILKCLNCLEWRVASDIIHLVLYYDVPSN